MQRKGGIRKKIRDEGEKTPTHKSADKILHSGPAPVTLASSGGRLGFRTSVRRAVAAVAGAAGRSPAPAAAAPAAGTRALAVAGPSRLPAWGCAAVAGSWGCQGAG